MNFPADNLITIVTVSLNNRAGLEKTMCSVISQRDAPFEYIVVDGGSDDGSVEIIKEYGHNLAKWISEADNGPYDAMNKGIGLASGEWIIFLNAGDIFNDHNALSAIYQQLGSNEIEALYGDSFADYGDFKIYRKAGPFREIWKGMIFSHQALVMRSSLLKNNGFDTSYPKMADYDLILRCLQKPGRVRYLAVPFVICDAKGISTRGQRAILQDYYRRSKQTYHMVFSRKVYFFKTYIFLVIIDLAKMVLPEKFYYRMIRLIRKKQNPE